MEINLNMIKLQFYSWGLALRVEVDLLGLKNHVLKKEEIEKKVWLFCQKMNSFWLLIPTLNTLPIVFYQTNDSNHEVEDVDNHSMEIIILKVTWLRNFFNANKVLIWKSLSQCYIKRTNLLYLYLITLFTCLIALENLRLCKLLWY